MADQEYAVCWDVRVHAPTPEEAAKKAFEILKSGSEPMEVVPIGEGGIYRFSARKQVSP